MSIRHTELPVITREQIESVEPGLYRLDEERLFTGRSYDPLEDVFRQYNGARQIRLVRVRPDEKVPLGVEHCPGFEVIPRLDGKFAYSAWDFDNWNDCEAVPARESAA